MMGGLDGDVDDEAVGSCSIDDEPNSRWSMYCRRLADSLNPGAPGCKSTQSAGLVSANISYSD